MTYHARMSDAIIDLSPCQPFLVSSGPALPTDACCQVAQTVLQQATEVPKSLCECFKNVAKGLGVNLRKLNNFPLSARSGLPYPLTLTPILPAASNLSLSLS
jgi:hypothetical protein